MLALAGCVLAAVVAGVVWLRPAFLAGLLPAPPATLTAPEPAPPPLALQGVAPVAPRHIAATASPLAILAHRADDLTLFRVEPNPAILVFDFPSLRQQGLMFNRVAALVEKAGLPRDAVLDDAALAAAIAARNETIETFYYGHNYRAADLVRFFTLAAVQGVALNDEERRLIAILNDLGIAPLGEDGLPRLSQPAAVLTIPGEQPGDAARGQLEIDTGVRQTILRHELSHGEFFTNNAYEDHVKAWWEKKLNAAERDLFRRFLADGGYDPAVEEVMMNEAMAYLMHTPDPRFFSASVLGTDEAMLARLRAAFMDGLSDTWLSRQDWPTPR